MFVPNQLDLTIYQGSTFIQEFDLESGDPAVPFDVSDWTARMQIRAEKASTSIIAELSTSDGSIVMYRETSSTGAVVRAGFRLKLSAAKTSALSFESAVYDIELTNPDGDTGRIQEGNVTLDFEVTR